MTNATSEAIVETVRAEFDFSVDKFPLSGPDGMKTDIYGLFRSDNSQFIGRPCKKDYVAHQADDVLALVDAASEAFDGVGEVQCHFNHGHYVSISPGKEERRAIYGTADNIFPRFIVNAGYDGKSFNATIGYYRDVCRNMAMMRQVRGTTVSIRHGSNLRSRMDDLITTFGSLRESWGSLEKLAVELESRPVRLLEFMNNVYGVPAENAGSNTLGRWEKRQRKIVERVMRERFQTNRPELTANPEVSAWEAWNAIQGYSQHEQSRKGSPSSFARILATANDPFVKKAESAILALVS